jgi:UDP-3-O-[3-hydroxymyristoyl] glucosamine N-acyltransferase
MKVRDIATIIDGEVLGDENLDIKGVSGLKTAKKGDISFVTDTKSIDLAKMSKASCFISGEPLSLAEKTVILSKNPALSFIRVIESFYPHEVLKPGISELAIIGERSSIGNNSYIAPYVVIGSDVTIGRNVRINPLTYIGCRSEIGNDVEIDNSVTIIEKTIIGNRVIIHPGTVIGSDGFGYVTEKKRRYKIPQIGRVVIEDDCEIGANVAIDRASFGETRIKKGTKIDNLVQIGHNVTVDENSLLVAQVGIAGSCKIGKNVTLAGQVGVADHLEIGDGAVVAAQGGVTKNIPPNALFSGYPARDHNLARRIYAASVKLPDLLKRIRKIEKTIEKIERENSQKNKDV